jgi:DNA-directed RNA polymerase specialized sigma24 family protein
MNELSTTVQPKNFYVDNRSLYEALVEWQKQIRSNNRKKLPKPPLPDFVAECMVKMANRLSQKAGFVNYTYREDMVGDALESCLRYIHNFDPAKSTNAFAYITQIIHNAFIRRIQKEQKQLYVKMKIIDQSDFADSYERQDGDSTNYNNSYVTYLQENKGDIITKFENWKEGKKTRANAKKSEANLNELFEDDPKTEKAVVVSKPVVKKKVVKKKKAA